MKKTLLILGVCFALAASAALIAGSCAAGDPAVTLMIGRSTKALVFLDCRAAAEDELEFNFSRPVKLKSITIEPQVKIDSVENGSTVKVMLQEKLPAGIVLLADLLAEDENKNSINVLTRLKSRNNRMPRMVINEVRTENSNPQCEFIEFKMKSDGNLGGLRVFILGNTNAASKTVYEFSAVEVKNGDFVMLNLRTPEAECKDEYGADLSESGGRNSSPNSRDFWIPGSTKLIHKTSVVYVLDQDENVLASLMMSEKPDAWWARTEFAEAAEFLYSKGAWTSPDGKICSPAQAVITAGTTATRTICRDETVENSNTAADWYITATSGATPGRANDARRYQ